MKTAKEKFVRGYAAPRDEAEQGFMLLGLIVAIAIILIFLGAAAAKVAFSLRREREVESARRADQYVRAIRKYYLKNQHYPGSIEELEKGVGIRYLRQRYVDPLTGKDDYRLIQVGKNQTTVKGFFGEPLAGIASTGLGSAANMQAPGVAGPTTAGPAGNPVGGAANSGNSSSTGTTTSPGGAAGGPGIAGSTSGSSFGSTLNSQLGSLGPFMGVGSSATGNSILVVNEQTTYQTWEFLYDPRVEKLRAAAALNAGASSVGASALGTTTNSTNTTNSNGGGAAQTQH